MPTALAFTVVMTPVDGGWVQAQLRELPGVITCAPTQDEARAAVVDALREYLASLADPSIDVPAGNATDVVRIVIEAA